MQVNKTHTGANKQNYIKARPLRTHSKYLLCFSLSLISLNNLQHTITLSRLFHISITLQVKRYLRTSSQKLSSCNLKQLITSTHYIVMNKTIALRRINVIVQYFINKTEMLRKF